MEQIDNLEQTLAFKIAKLSNLISQPFYIKYGKDEDLYLPEWRIIQTLAINPQITSKHLCQIIGMHKMNVSRAVKRLEKLGRLKCETSNNDKRAKLLELTHEGQKLYERLKPGAQARAAELASGLSNYEIKTLNDLINKLIIKAGEGLEA